MADYRALAQALDPYAMDTGGITPDTLKALQTINKSPNLLGMIADIGRGGLSNLESLIRGGVAQVPGTAGDLETLGRMGINTSFGAGGVKVSPKAVLPTTTDILGMMPQRVTQARPETAGMEELGTMIAPGLAKAVAPVGKGYLSLLGNEINAGMTGQPTRSVIGQMTPKPLQIFIGENAKTWDKVDAVRAQAMEKKGATPEEIWTETGTFRGPEGKWRQEISDQNLGIQDFRNTGGALVIKHPELQASYKQLPRGVKVVPTPEYQQMASYEAPNRELDWQLGEGGTIRVPTNEPTPIDVYAHELQHAVQAKEGFARGGSPAKMILVLEDLAKQKREEARTFFDLSTNKDPLNPQIIKPGAREKGLALEKEARQLEDQAMLAYHSEQAKFDLYNKLSGEAEARAVQERLNMTDAERRAKFPYQSYDVPINELIVRK